MQSFCATSTISRANVYLGFLDCPIGPWLQNYPAWRTPQLSGALFHLLLAAWRQQPCATLPDDDERLAAFAMLDVEEFKAVKADLMLGFAHDGLRFVCEELAQRATVLAENHAEALSRLQAGVVATTLDPEHFSLHSDVPVAQEQERRRRRKLPTGFCLTPGLLLWGSRHMREEIGRQGGKEPSDEQAMAALQQILGLFKQDARSNARMYEDWDAAFRMFVTRQLNGEFGNCAMFFPELFPISTAPASPLLSTGPRRSSFNKREALDQSADRALQELLGARSRDAGVVDLNETLTARQA